MLLPVVWGADFAFSDTGTASPDSPTAMSDSAAVKLIREYCIDCHAGDDAESGLDLESFRSSAEIGAAIETWNRVADRVRERQMPPEESESPSADSRTAFVAWVRSAIHSAVCDDGVSPGGGSRGHSIFR